MSAGDSADSPAKFIHADNQSYNVRIVTKDGGNCYESYHYEQVGNIFTLCTMMSFIPMTPLPLSSQKLSVPPTTQHSLMLITSFPFQAIQLKQSIDSFGAHSR